MMNVELMRKIADEIESHPLDYDQSEYGSGADPRDCGSACCVAGWARVLSKFSDIQGLDRFIVQRKIHHDAKEALGLDEQEAGCLFEESWPWAWYDRIGIDTKVAFHIPSAREAAMIFRGMANDGVVWGIY